MRPLHFGIGRSLSAAGAISKASRPSSWVPPSVPLKRKISSGGESPDRLRRKVDAHLAMADETNYNSWTKTGLIERLRELETELRRRPALPEVEADSEPKLAAPEETANVLEPQDGQLVDASQAEQADGAPKKPKGKRKIDPSRYATRFIALKLAYLGKKFGGYEFQAMGNQPSIEEELWKALTKACLIFPKDNRIVDFDCCEYSKCGRTDRGVSAFGQVIALRLRSNRPVPKTPAPADEDEAAGNDANKAEGVPSTEAMDVDQPDPAQKPFDDVLDELDYPRMLNRILPPEIRILAWCPSPPPEFSARFSCRERQYRYFFTQPAFVPEPSSGGGTGVQTGWLDIEAMREAAKRYEGEHDFRNLCKIDPAKQITNFSRRIFEADVVEVKDAQSIQPFLKGPRFSSPHLSPGEAADGVFPKVYYFHVRGSAFLWHQIRHMVSILFLVGQGLEPPSVVSDLLDVQRNPSKPSYTMADEVPLVLWDCIFPESLVVDPAPNARVNSLDWVYAGEVEPDSKFGQYGLADSVWATWRDTKVDELLASQLMQQVTEQGGRALSAKAISRLTNKPKTSARIFEGGNTGRLGGKYVPVLKKKLQMSPEDQNDKYAKRKGYKDAEDMRQQRGFRNAAVVEPPADE